MKTTRECDLAYLSYESKVLIEDITFDEFLTEWSSKPRKIGNQIIGLFHDFLVKNRTVCNHCFVHQAS